MPAAESYPRTVEVGGNALATQPAAGGAAEVVGVLLAAVVPLITFGSPTAAGLPLLTAVIQALRAGASGFLGKDVSAEVLLGGIRTVAAGDSLLSPAATRALITRFLAAPGPETRLVPAERLNALTARERVMALAALGGSNTDIAGELVVSPLTVRSHIQRAMTKLNARDRAQLVVIAYQSGLVRP